MNKRIIAALREELELSSAITDDEIYDLCSYRFIYLRFAIGIAFSDIWKAIKERIMFIINKLT